MCTDVYRWEFLQVFISFDMKYTIHSIQDKEKQQFQKKKKYFTIIIQKQENI